MRCFPFLDFEALTLGALAEPPILLGVDSPFLSAIVIFLFLFKTRHFSRRFGGFLERRIPGFRMDMEVAPRFFPQRTCSGFVRMLVGREKGKRVFENPATLWTLLPSGALLFPLFGVFCFFPFFFGGGRVPL